MFCPLKWHPHWGFFIATSRMVPIMSCKSTDSWRIEPFGATSRPNGTGRSPTRCPNEWLEPFLRNTKVLDTKINDINMLRYAQIMMVGHDKPSFHPFSPKKKHAAASKKRSFCGMAMPLARPHEATTAAPRHSVRSLVPSFGRPQVDHSWPWLHL